MDASHRRPRGTGKGSRLGMREIAARVGVSPITVSRALKDPSKVSPETRQRILDAIEREGFIPNQLASSMRGAGRIIGTMVPPLINSGIAEQVQGMSDETHESGYQLLLMQGDFGAARLYLARAAQLEAGRDPAIYDHLGDAAYRLGDREAARAHWEKARELLEDKAGAGRMAARAGLIVTLRGKLLALEQATAPNVAPTAAERVSKDKP